MMLPFSVADWLVIAAYLLLLVAGGWIFTPRKWRNLGLGPRYCKIGRYAATDIEVFVKESYKEVA